MATTCSDPVVLWGLFSAAYGGSLAEVKSLLKTNGLAADVSDPNTGSTVLQWASCGGSLEVVEWLVKEAGAKVTQRNKDDRTAFFFACEHCHKPVAEFLVDQRGVNVNEKDKPAGHSPLHRACIAGQTRDTKAADAKVLISWLLTEGNADANAADLSGRVPGEADLTAEAPKLKPTSQAAEIRKMLEDARTGDAPVILTETAPPTPAPADVPAAAAGVAVKPISKPEPGRKQESKLAPAPRSEPASTRASATSASTDAAAAGRPMMTLASARAAATTTKKPAAVPAAACGDGGSAVTVAASDASVPPRLPSPSRVAERAAALASKAAPVSTSSRPEATPAEAAVKAKATHSSAPVASIKGSASPGLKAPSSSPPPRRNAEERTEPSSRPPWNVKLRPGGVQPRSGGGPPTAASSVPTERGGVTARLVPTEATAAEKKTAPVPKHYAYGQKNAAPAESSSSSSASGNGAVAQSSVPPGRFPRPSMSGSLPDSGSATGAAAAAVIEASNGPKASALAAAFENKSRGRQASPPPGRRGHSGTSSTLAAKAPAQSSVGVSGRSNGGGKVASRSGASASPSVQPVEKVTPEELLASGSVMQKTKMYVAAAKGTQGPAPSKDDPAPLLAKGKKGKEGSFMDKIVSIFTVSPESSPSSSPTRSPKLKPRSPMAANGGAANATAVSSPYENARMGFFHTNKSFKMDVGDKE